MTADPNQGTLDLFLKFNENWKNHLEAVHSLTFFILVLSG